MGAPSDNDADRKAPHEDETPVDDAWTEGSPAHNDQTTARLHVDPATVGRLTAGLGRHPVAASTDHDRTVVGPGAEQSARATAADSAVASLDQTLAVLEGPDAVASNDRTKRGLGVATPGPRPGFTLLDPVKGTIPLEKERALVQPERSPLDLVMRELDPAAPPRAHASGDSSRFVAALVGDQPPPRVDDDSLAIPAMQPVLRRSRRRRWLAAAALAVIAVLGTAFAMKLTGAEEPTTTAASAAAEVAETSAPVAAVAAAPTPSDVATPTAPPDPSQVAAPPDPTIAPAAAEAPPESAPAAKPEMVAIARTSETKDKPAKTPSTGTKPATAKKAVAAKDAEKSSTAKKPVAAKNATAKKSSTTVASKNATAKKPSTAQKKATAKKSTANSSMAKKSSTAKKSPTPKKSQAATKPSNAKKTTSTKKSSRSHRTGRQTRRS